jgi:tetratricopeptide (TPR) repeat protein
MPAKKKPGPNDEKKALIGHAEKALGRFEPELAVQFLTRAHEKDALDTSVMDSLGRVYLQLGDSESAMRFFLQSCSVSPDASPYKWMFLGQLQESNDSLNSYSKGISLLMAMIGSDGSRMNEIELEKLKKEISSAYCSIAELYMTDLCFDDNAELKCQSAVEKAFEFQHDSLDARMSCASLRISQQRPLEAADIIEGVCSTLITLLKNKLEKPLLASFQQGGEGQDEEEEQDDIDPEFCVSVVKLLLECAEVKSNLANCSVELLDLLLDLDDSNIENWYLAGVAAMSCRPVDHDSAKLHLDRAMEMVESLRTSSIQMESEDGGMDMDGCNDNDEYETQYTLINNALEALAQCPKGETIPVVDEVEDDDVMEEDEEWE